MGTNIRCFVLDPTDLVRVNLRRYVSSSEPHSKCAANPIGFHNGHRLWHDHIECGAAEAEKETLDHSLWPTRCDTCDYVFSEADAYQYFTDALYRHREIDELFTTRNAQPGALVRVTHLEEYSQWVSPSDGQCWQVMLPSGNWWQIDSRASNCDSPCKHCGQPYHSHQKERCSNPGYGGYSYTIGSYDDRNPDHRCWVRHGIAPDLHVDKSGNTCGAGAGSIWSCQGKPNEYHGFLSHGHLTNC